MKKTILTLIVGCSATLAPTTRAQDTTPPPPEQEPKKVAEPKEIEARLTEERRQFEKKMEDGMRGAMEKAAQLEAEGKKEEAEEVRAQARKKLQTSIENHRREMQAKMREMNQRDRAARLERAERQRDRERAERREQKQAKAPGLEGHDAGHRPDGPAAPHRPDHRPDGPPRPELESKLHHVEQAISHLREAGLPDPAANLERVAQRLRNAMHESQGPAAGHGPHPDGPPHGKRPDGPPREELGALRREVEELRQTVDKLCKMQKAEEKKDAPDKHH
jgi:hypothetical protein